MAEIELKFQVPSHMHAQLQQDFISLTLVRNHLWARYFDTTENMSLYKFAWCHHAPGYAYNS